MKVEEKEVKLRMILTDYHRRNDYELQQAVNDILALDALPPAEGAAVAYYPLSFITDAIASEQQPTAEGAEEILEEEKILLLFNKHSNCLGKSPIKMPCMTRSAFVSAVKEFATLHAQKIADKMVSERLREELIKYDRWMSGNYWGVKQIPTPEQSVDEYLKSRER